MKILSHSHILQLPDSLPQRQPTLLFSSRDFKANTCLHLCMYMYSFSSIRTVAQHTWYLGILNFYLNNMSWDHPAYYIPSSFFFWQSCAAWKILVPWPEIEAKSPAMEAWGTNHWTTPESPFFEGSTLHFLAPSSYLEPLYFSLKKFPLTFLLQVFCWWLLAFVSLKIFLFQTVKAVFFGHIILCW